METLEQLERATLDRKTRSWQFEQVQNALLNATQLVDNITPQVKSITQSLVQLAALQDLAAQLSPDILGSGGARCRDHVILSCAAGVKHLSKRRDRLQTQLDAASAKIPTLEKQLEEYS